MTLLVWTAILSWFVCVRGDGSTYDRPAIDKAALKAQAHEMFLHAYRGYMEHAYPHDELMPLSCRPRIRGITPSRGDVDDSLGNFSLTLVDTLDTLAVMGEYEEFERAVHSVIRHVRFDADFIVSVFETNIRMIGGLISAHVISKLVREKVPNRLGWYDDQLLRMATDLADRLLPAFNTTSGVPHSRINLKHGLSAALKNQADTCTACAGTIILEWAALSRLTGNPIYEEKARKAMDFLWNQRNHGSDLMGTVLNVNSGDWVRRDAGIGAGIDSYYEYTLKAYILLGEEEYLHRFNRHYESVMRYLNKGPLFIDVHMHRPLVASRSYMDSLLAFWPGVQVLKGDLKGAIEIHEMLYQVIKKHKFLPEAFTHDLQIHWAQHPLRPEFLESTYFLYRATKDQHYLEVAEHVMQSIDDHCRTKCGFAAVKDIRTMEMLDEMESFVTAETFKYLYMIFAEPGDLLFDPDNYVLTTEAHFLPLSIGDKMSPDALPRRMMIDPDEVINDESPKRYQSVCPIASEYRTLDELSQFGNTIRSNVKKLLGELTSLGSYAALLTGQSGVGQTLSTSEIQQKAMERLRAWAFSSSNPKHIEELRKMGIQVQTLADGKIQLIHSANEAENALMAIHGIEFMQEMVQLSQEMEKSPPNRMDRFVQLISEPLFGHEHFLASPAQFGPELADEDRIVGELALAEPYNACGRLENAGKIAGRIAIARRGDCMFQEKVLNLQNVGAIAVIIIDNQQGTSATHSPLFAMSADKNLDVVEIPAIFLFHYEGQKLLNRVLADYRLIVQLSDQLINPAYLVEEYLRGRCCDRRPPKNQNDFLDFDPQSGLFQLSFHLEDENFHSLLDSKLKPLIRRQFDRISRGVYFETKREIDAFRYIISAILRQLHKGRKSIVLDADTLKNLVGRMRLQPTYGVGPVKLLYVVRCHLYDEDPKCSAEAVQPPRVFPSTKRVNNQQAKTEL